jgi:ACS family sodium-dependent inorganic phosphate cotransporter
MSTNPNEIAIASVDHLNDNNNATEIRNLTVSSDVYRHHIDDYFAWDKQAQGLLLSAYFYGYIFPNLFGGSLAEIYGARKVIFIALFISSIITGISPFAASDNFIYMFIMRLILGLMGGFLYPASHQLISKWAPFEEKGKFVSTLLGGVFGTMITWPLTGYLSEAYGWRLGFYVPAIVGIIISFLWLYFVHDSPETHPRIAKSEKELIEKSLGPSIKNKKSWPPMNLVLTSPAFYSLLLLHFGGTFGLFFLITAAPKFMSEVLKFNLTEAGLLSSLPYLARLIFGYFFGSIGDMLKAKKVLSTTSIRKTFCIFCKLI